MKRKRTSEHEKDSYIRGERVYLFFCLLFFLAACSMGASSSTSTVDKVAWCDENEQYYTTTHQLVLSRDNDDDLPIREINTALPVILGCGYNGSVFLVQGSWMYHFGAGYGYGGLAENLGFNITELAETGNGRIALIANGDAYILEGGSEPTKINAEGVVTDIVWNGAVQNVARIIHTRGGTVLAYSHNINGESHIRLSDYAANSWNEEFGPNEFGPFEYEIAEFAWSPGSDYFAVIDSDRAGVHVVEKASGISTPVAIGDIRTPDGSFRTDTLENYEQVAWGADNKLIFIANYAGNPDEKCLFILEYGQSGISEVACGVISYSVHPNGKSLMYAPLSGTQLQEVKL